MADKAQNPRPVPALCKRLETWLAVHRPDSLEALAPGASAEDLSALDAIDLPVPQGLKDFLAWRNGLKEDEFDGMFHNHQMMSVEGILGSRDMMNELLESGDFDEENWWNRRWIPFLDNGGGDNYCIDLEGCFGGAPGQVLMFVHDDPMRDIEFPSFEAWLETFVDSVEAGMWQDEEGDFHPKDDDAWTAFREKKNPGFPKDAHAGSDDDDDDDDDEDDEDDDDDDDDEDA